MSLGWQVLVIIGAGIAGGFVYLLIVGSEIVNGADRDLDADRARRGYE